MSGCTPRCEPVHPVSTPFPSQPLHRPPQQHALLLLLLLLQEDGSGVRVKVENALQAELLRTCQLVETEFVSEDMSQKSLSRVLMEKAWWVARWRGHSPPMSPRLVLRVDCCGPPRSQSAA